MMKVREYRRMQNWVGYKLIVGGEEVGFAGVVRFEDGITYLERIDIYDGQQGRGYGTKFIEWLANRYDGIYAAPDNEDSQRLFERLGEDDSNGEMYGYDQGFGVYEILWCPVDGIEFYVDHEIVEPPKQDARTVIVDPLGKGKAKS